MIRMNLDQLVSYMEIIGLSATADYFKSCKSDSVTVDGWIEEDFVKRHLQTMIMGDPNFWKELQSNIIFWLPDTN